MGQYNSAIPTNAGLAMVAQSISGGQTVTFTKLRTSSYQYPSGTDYAALTSLIGIQQTVDITYASTADKKTVKVNATVTNAGVSTAYTIRNLGVYAKIGDGTETLFAVIPAGAGDSVPVYSDTTRVSYIFSITIAVGTATGLTVNVTTAGMASVVDLQDTATEIYASLTPTIASSQVVENASGMIATFDDGADGAPMRSVNVEIEPVQDLRGQASPYPAGTGKNKYQMRGDNYTNHGVTLTANADGTVNISGATDAASATLSLISTAGAAVLNQLFNGGGTFILSLNKGTFDSNNFNITINYRDSATGTNKNIVPGTAVTIPAGSTFNASNLYVAANQTVPSVEGFAIQLESGSTATAFAPYANICPISGRESVKVTRAGKNLLPYPYAETTKTENDVTFTDTGDGIITTEGTASVRTVFRLVRPENQYVLPRGTYTVSKGFQSAQVSLLVDAILNRTWVRTLARSSSADEVTFTVDYADYDRIQVYLEVPGNTDMDGVEVKPMIRPASETDATFAPYTADSITVSLGGTVYGGTVDAVGGTLTVDRALYTWNAGESGARLNARNVYILNKSDAVTIDVSNQGTLEGAVCDTLPSATWTALSEGTASAAGCVYGNGLAFRVAGYTTQAEYEAFLTENPLTFAYLLKEPVTTRIDPKILRSLFGLNNVWSDAGDVDVDYVADLKTYIDRKIAEATA